jgi:hypothetical protein
VKRRWKVEWYSKLTGHRINQQEMGLPVRYFFTEWGANRHAASMPPSPLVWCEVERVQP